MPNNLNEYRDPNQNYGPPVQYNGPRKLDTGQKTAIAVLAIFAILVVFVWVVQTRNSLSPQDRNISTGLESANCPGGNCPGVATEADLRLKDTDKDGLSDYDELYIYGTSPYLEDSDSDGISDFVEVQRGTDPNCPTGQNCVAPPAAEDRVINNPLENFTPINEVAPVNVEELIDTSEKVLMGGGDAASLRTMLGQAGMDPEVLKQISDEELMATYQEIMAN